MELCFSLRESRLEKSLNLQSYLNEMLHGVGACTTPVAAEDQRCFLSMQPVHRDSNKPHEGFHCCFKGPQWFRELHA